MSHPQQRVASDMATDARRQLIAAMPVTERHLTLAGIGTNVLHGGAGTPVILLHGPFGYGAHWLRIVPELAKRHQVIAPDLPGHGGSDAVNAALDIDTVLAWLGELVARTCTSRPALVAHALGGAIAARFACRDGERISRLVLSDTFGLAPFDPQPQFGQALQAFLAGPSRQTHSSLWKQCAFELPELQRQLGSLWTPFEAYNLERSRTPAVMSSVLTMMNLFGVPIPQEDLARIRVPTTLIWGRHDRAVPLQIAEAASARYGWPMTVIESSAADPSIEQPNTFMSALLAGLGEQS
jgi:pimeloyl-ACP methyl ester carboxylesterase